MVITRLACQERRANRGKPDSWQIILHNFIQINNHIKLQYIEINLRAHKNLGIRIICKEENYRLNIITINN